jgi:galactose mutarotase-like enzyme
LREFWFKDRSMTDPRTIITIRSDLLSASIDPLGAQLFALRDSDGLDLQWDGDPAVWTGRAPILFPIVGMLEQGRYRLVGKTYRMAKHGFGRHKLFKVIEAEAACAIFRLKADEETLAVYPFRFQLDIRFAIEGARLSLTALVRNLGDEAMPASFGFHPALRWPLPYGHPRANHGVRFEHDEPAPIRRVNQEGVVKPETYPSPVTGRDLALRDNLFVDDALIFDRLNSQAVSYGAAEGPRIEVAFPDTPYLGIWTKPGADFICIEPWHGIADPAGFDGDFRTKPGVLEVAPNSEKRIEMTITLKR